VSNLMDFGCDFPCDSRRTYSSSNCSLNAYLLADNCAFFILIVTSYHLHNVLLSYWTIIMLIIRLGCFSRIIIFFIIHPFLPYFPL